MVSLFHGIGLMSGTSLDGLDIAYCSFKKSNSIWKYKIEKCACVNFPKHLYEQLKSAPCLTAIDLLQLDVAYGKWIGEQVDVFINQHQISPQFIASHGYTVYHQPENGFTHQIGCGESIYSITKIPVINNFRQLDVCLGGQGAPLVPIGDQLLFGEYTACLNLGGIANISFDNNRSRIAYDICPVNMVLNYIAEKRNKRYDEGGQMARNGSINVDLFNTLEKLAYYKKSHPKSLGFEWVDEHIFNNKYFKSCTPEDLAKTTVEHICHRIKAACLKFKQAENKTNKILVTGGGTFNDYLIESLALLLGDDFQIVKPNKELIDYKEALIFAFLGLLRLNGAPNTLKSVTGATNDSCGGQIIGGHLNLLQYS